MSLQKRFLFHSTMKLNRNTFLKIIIFIMLCSGRTTSLHDELLGNHERINHNISSTSLSAGEISKSIAKVLIAPFVQTRYVNKNISTAKKLPPNYKNQNQLSGEVYTRFKEDSKEANGLNKRLSVYSEDDTKSKEFFMNRRSLRDPKKNGNMSSEVHSEHSRPKRRTVLENMLSAFSAVSPTSSCPSLQVDCSLFKNDQYGIYELSPSSHYTNISGMVEYVEDFVCKPAVKPRIAIETKQELAELIECYLCDDMSDFSVQVKTHVLTGGIVDTSEIGRNISPSDALENYGNWENWPSDMKSRVPREVLLVNPTTGLEEPATVPVEPDVYAVVLLGSPSGDTNCPLNECIYWKWGLVSYSAASEALKHISFVLCQDPDNESTIDSETTSVSSLNTTTTITTTLSSTTSVSPTTTVSSTSSSTEATPSSTTFASSTTIPTTTSTTTTTTTAPDVDVCCSIDMDLYRYWLCPGEVKRVACPTENHVGWQTITCISEKQVIILEDNCLMQWIDDIQNMIESGNHSAVSISHEVRNYTNQESVLSPYELETLVGVLHNLTILAELQVQLIPDMADQEVFLVDYNDNFVHIVADILSVPLTWDGLEKEFAGQSGGALLFNLETSGFLLASHINDTVHHFSSLELNMTVSATARSAASGLDVYIPNAHNPIYLHLPKNFENLLPDEESQVKLVVFLLQQCAASRALPAKLSRGVPDGSYKEINSGVLSATLGKEGHHLNFSQINDYVVMRFQHAFQESGPYFRDLYRDQRPGEVATPVPGTAVCVYWDTAKTLWSPDGCKVLNTTREVTYCACQHLTIISIITDIHGYVGRDQVLDIMGTILTSMSCIALAVAFCIFHFYKSIASPRVTITKQLCVALGIAQLLLLFLLDKDYLKLSETACSISAMVLHYWMTAAIFWMLAEGLHLLQTVSDVLSHISYMPAYWLLGYGVPLMLVVSTLLVAYGMGQWSFQGAYAPPNSEYCWLTTEDGYIWAFTGPLLIIIILNTVTMILALRSAARLRTNQQKTLREQVKLWVKGCFSLNCILGTTWVFGFLYINTAHVFAYIFTIFNASQGMMILLLHCIVNDTVRKAIIISLPHSISRHLKQEKKRAKGQTVAAISRGSTSPAVTTVHSLATTPATSPESTPPTVPIQRRKDTSREMGRVRDSNKRRSPPIPRAITIFPDNSQPSIRRESLTHNVAATSVEVSTPRIHRPIRNGSQLSNSTLSTFISDPYSSYNCSRRTSLESYDSSNSSSSEDSCPSYTEIVLKMNEDYYGHADISRYIPGFAAIQECDEKSLRSSFSY